MVSNATDPSLRRAVRVAGLAYLLIIVTSMLAVIFIELRLVVPGDVAATISNITANESLYRLGAAYDLLMFASVVVLAVALYAVLKTVSRNLALLALLWRLGEAIVGIVTVLASLVILHLLSGGGHSTVPEMEQVRGLVGLLLNVRAAGLTVLTAFLCLGTIIFCYLFFKSRYVPRALAVWGMAACLLMLAVAFAGILVRDLPRMVETACVMPVALFEAVIGLWLLFKGIAIRPAGGGRGRPEHMEGRLASP